jgi:hypothetical protein
MLQLHRMERQNPRTLFWEWDQAWLLYIACVACMLPLLELLPTQPLKLDTQRIASKSNGSSSSLLLRVPPVAALWQYFTPPGGLSNTGAAFLAFYIVWTLAYLVATVKLRTDSQEGQTFDDIGYLADLSLAARVWYNIASICG